MTSLHERAEVFTLNSRTNLRNLGLKRAATAGPQYNFLEMAHLARQGDVVALRPELIAALTLGFQGSKSSIHK